MKPGLNLYRSWISKSLLVAVYIFFFAAQINGRFYSIANFFVYQSGQARVSMGTGAAGQSAFRSPRHQLTHLSLDKRFYGRDGIKAEACKETVVFSQDYIIVSVRFALLAETPVQITPLTRCLRGPPFNA